MEQLMVTEGYAVQTTGRMLEIAHLSKNVKLRLSKEQLAALGKVTGHYIRSAMLTELDDKVIFYLIWDIYESKLRKKILSLKQEVGLTLDLPHAWALMQMCFSVELTAWPYEESVMRYIIQEIDHQTV